MPRHSQRCGAIALATGFFFTVVCAPAQVRAQGTPKTASPHSEPTPAASDETELTAEERAEIEEALSEDAAPPGQSGNDAGGVMPSVASLLPDTALILDMALAYFSDDEPLQTGGHDPKQTGFNLQQLELSMGKSVDPYFRLDASILFSFDGVELEEAYASTLALPGDLGVRAGQFLTAFGRFNSTHLHTWTFADQPFMWGEVFGPDGQRGLGAEISYLAPLPWYVELSGAAISQSGHVHGHGEEAPTDETDSGDDPHDDHDDHAHADEPSHGSDSAESHEEGFVDQLTATVALKQFFELSDNWSLLWGLSGSTGPAPELEEVRQDVLGTDVYLKYRPIDRASPTVVALQAEWLFRRRRSTDRWHDTGGYAQLFWRFAKRWGTAARYEYGSSIFDADWDVVSAPQNGDPHHAPLSEARHRTAVNVSFWPTEFSRLRFQNGLDLPGARPLPIFSSMLSLEVAIGSHGTHRF